MHWTGEVKRSEGKRTPGRFSVDRVESEERSTTRVELEYDQREWITLLRCREQQASHLRSQQSRQGKEKGEKVRLPNKTFSATQLWVRMSALQQEKNKKKKKPSESKRGENKKEEIDFMVGESG